jgi:hypothetical protein
MASSAPTSDEFADRRAYPRVSVALPAFLEAEGERHHVQILDLSAGGAKLKCQISLSAGTAVTLDCGILRRAAVVRWQDGPVLGLCFESELDPRDVSDLAGRSTALAARMKSAD